MRNIVLIAHNLRSIHNAGSLLRTAEGLGVDAVYLTGYTPYPRSQNDPRLPHESQKIDKQIAKTALGAEKYLNWHHHTDIESLLKELTSSGYLITGLEQAPNSIQLPAFNPPAKVALIVGREVEGIEPEILKLCNAVLEIPMFGKKESFNVVQAAAMALYHLRFTAA
jgi:23S rRNA (guanosine2251-2'-O)-methyltransferase